MFNIKYVEDIQDPHFKKVVKTQKEIEELKIKEVKESEGFAKTGIGLITIKNRDKTDKSKVKTVKNGKVIE